MKIKKLGHSCLVVEEKGIRIMTDPGNYAMANSVQEFNIDLILITHEHQDHFHLESLKEILANNPDATIVTNSTIGKLLDEAGITYEILEEGQSKDFGGVQIEAYGNQHAFIRSGLAPIQNTGYFIANKLFFPGDAFTNPNKPVDILALPSAGPWLKIEEVLQYAKIVNPRNAFPVHDGSLNELGLGYLKTVPAEVLNPLGIHFKVLEIGREEEFD
jgi:L-ascorbate metabolism protein UlaG (beta-lactamase superfamily)